MLVLEKNGDSGCFKCPECMCGWQMMNGRFTWWSGRKPKWDRLGRLKCRVCREFFGQYQDEYWPRRSDVEPIQEEKNG